MICPHCNIQMDHLNKGYGYSGVDAYQTYDYVQCKKCGRVAIEFYHTEFVESSMVKPVFTLDKSWHNGVQQGETTILE